MNAIGRVNRPSTSRRPPKVSSKPANRNTPTIAPCGATTGRRPADCELDARSDARNCRHRRIGGAADGGDGGIGSRFRGGCRGASACRSSTHLLRWKMKQLLRAVRHVNERSHDPEDAKHPGRVFLEGGVHWVTYLHLFPVLAAASRPNQSGNAELSVRDPLPPKNRVIFRRNPALQGPLVAFAGVALYPRAK